MATATSKPRHWPTSEHAELFAAIASLRTTDEVERFLRDLCTISELDAMAHRWQVAQLLDEGLPYLEVARQLGHGRPQISNACLGTLVARTPFLGASLASRSSV